MLYDTALIRCVYHDRAGASPHLLLLLYDTACLNPPGIYRSRGSTTAPSGTTLDSRIKYYIIISSYGVSARQRLFRIATACFLFSAPSSSSIRGYSSAMSRLPRTSRGLIFFSLLFILLLFMNGCPEDDLKI